MLVLLGLALAGCGSSGASTHAQGASHDALSTSSASAGGEAAHEASGSGSCPLSTSQVSAFLGTSVPKTPEEPTPATTCGFMTLHNGAPDISKPALVVIPFPQPEQPTTPAALHKELGPSGGADTLAERPQWGDGSFFTIKEGLGTLANVEMTQIDIFTPSTHVYITLPEPLAVDPRQLADEVGNAAFHSPAR